MGGPEPGELGPRIVRRPAARVLCLAAERWVLLLRWRDPVVACRDVGAAGGRGGAGGDCCCGRAAGAAGGDGVVVAGPLAGPVMVPRDFVWDGVAADGRRAVLPGLRGTRCRPSGSRTEPALVGFAWVRVDAVAGLDVVEPPSLARGAQPPADGTTHPAIAMKCATAAAITSVWKTSWKPNVRGHRLGFRIA